MDGARFDSLTKTLASSRSRRGVLRLLAGGALAAAATTLGRSPVGAIPGCDGPCDCGQILCGAGCVTPTDQRCGCSGTPCGVCQQCNKTSCGPRLCPPDDNPCTVASCDPATGACGQSPLTGSACTTGAVPNGTCSDGLCCPNGSINCDGTCVDARTDPHHCGACGVACADRETCCNGKRVKLASDERNCGRCGKRCRRGQTCRKGKCR